MLAPIPFFRQYLDEATGGSRNDPPFAIQRLDPATRRDPVERHGQRVLGRPGAFGASAQQTGHQQTADKGNRLHLRGLRFIDSMAH